MPGKVVATFDYVDERGDLLYQVCRTDPKGFFQRRPIPGHPGDWAYTLGGGKYGRDPQSGYWYERANNWPPNELVDLEEVRRVPYRLPDLVDAGKAKQPVLVAEGEGKVDLLRALGFVATCAAGGAGKWPVGFGGHLVGRRVVVLPDMDDVGMVHAHMVMASCVMFGAESVRIVRYGMGWEQMPEKSDVKDWLALQPGEGKRAALIDLIKQQPEWRPAA
ncbi:MAG TPA: hypothetical protein VEI97_08265 [bacterium]|nr:hypothetical protein [bacterium]